MDNELIVDKLVPEELLEKNKRSVIPAVIDTRGQMDCVGKR